jgi:hypothetical protein
MNWNSKLGWTLRIGVGIFIAVVAFWQFQSRQAAGEMRDKARLVATVTAASLNCPNDSTPFEVTIRNLASRTVLEASFTFHEQFAPGGMLPSDRSVVSLDAPLHRGQTWTSCQALSLNRLRAGGADPRRVHFVPMLSHIVFQ